MSKPILGRETIELELKTKHGPYLIFGDNVEGRVIVKNIILPGLTKPRPSSLSPHM